MRLDVFRLEWVFLLLAAWLVMPMSPVFAASNSIRLLVSCGDGTGGLQSNCVQDIDSLNQWIVGRAPSRSNPVRIDIGPGEFQGTLECIGWGGITIHGAGRDSTTITSNLTYLVPGIYTSNCVGLNVAHLTVKGGYRAVHLGESSVTTWTDVEIIGGARGVYSTFGCDPSLTRHTWYNSRIEAIPRGMTVAYDARCGEHRIYGSELVANGSLSQYGGIPNNVVSLKVNKTINKVTVRVVGSVLSAVLNIPNGGAVPVSAIQVDNGAEVSVVGTQIDILSRVPHEVLVLSANTGGSIKVDGSSYKLATVSPGSVRRIGVSGGGVVQAHFHWAALPDPSQIPGYRSLHGADTSTWINGGHPHMLVYDETCPNGTNWYDSLDKICR